MSIYHKFLQKVQAEGWVIESVNQDACVVQCGVSGCNARFRIRRGADIPPKDVTDSISLDVPIPSFDYLRQLMKSRREDLGLTINEVEIAAGIAEWYLAKFEKENMAKAPSIDTVVSWINALGYELVIRPIDLPPVTVKMISETRARTSRRARGRQTPTLRQRRG